MFFFIYLFYFPSVQFSCGHVVLPAGTITRSIVPMQSLASSDQTNQNSTINVPDDYETNDNLSLAVNVSDLPSRPLKEGLSVDLLSQAEADRTEETDPPTEDFSWGFSTFPNITAETNSDQRIVGGDEAIPGEIPWQVKSFGVQNVIQLVVMCLTADYNQTTY